jgi:hypothetical protein
LLVSSFALAQCFVACAKTLFSHIREGNRFWADYTIINIFKRLVLECDVLTKTLFFGVVDAQAEKKIISH